MAAILEPTVKRWLMRGVASAVAIVILVTSQPSAISGNRRSLHLLPLVPAYGWLAFLTCQDSVVDENASAQVLVDDILARAKRAVMQGDCEQASAMLGRVPASQAEPWLGAIRLARGDYEAAKASWVSLNQPEAVSAWLANLAMAQSEAGEDARAVELFRLGESFAPLETVALRAYARSLEKIATAEGAVRLLRQAATRDPRDADVHYELGMALWRWHPGDPEAVAEVELAASIRDYFVYHYSLSSFYLQLGDLAAAERHAAVILRGPVGREDALVRMGLISAMKGDWLRAARYYDEAVVLLPTRDDIRQAAAQAHASLRSPTSNR